MRTAIVASTGRVAGAVVRELLAAHADLILLTRSPHKLSTIIGHEKIPTRDGNLSDAAVLKESLRGVDVLFWVTPSDSTALDLRASQRRMGKAAAEAIRANRISRVVNLSSLGAQHASGNGPVDGLHDVEKAIGGATENVIHLRPGYFFENFETQCQAIVQEGCIYLPVKGEVAVPMIATRDVARAAAHALLNPAWSGRIVHQLCPPAISFNEAAGRLSAVLGMPVSHVQVTDEQAQASMMEGGASEDIARRMCEMFHGIEQGTLAAEAGAKPDETPWTSLEEYAVDMLAPKLRSLREKRAAAG